MYVSINYSPNVAAAAAEYFQTITRTIFENAIDQENCARANVAMQVYGVYLQHADFLGRNKLSRSRDADVYNRVHV